MENPLIFMDREKTCLNRFLNYCKGCTKDYSDNHPNNYDCPYYKEFHYDMFEVYDESKLEELGREAKGFPQKKD